MNKFLLRAHELILAGDDTPGRRWLKEHLSGKLCPETGDRPPEVKPEPFLANVEDDIRAEQAVYMPNKDWVGENPEQVPEGDPLPF